MRPWEMQLQFYQSLPVPVQTLLYSLKLEPLQKGELCIASKQPQNNVFQFFLEVRYLKPPFPVLLLSMVAAILESPGRNK